MFKKLIPKFIILFAMITPSLVFSQVIDLATGANDQPIEITADNGIEWQRDNQLMIATGKAKATRGNANVEADTLRAFYEKDKKGNSNISRLDASGQVKITSPTQKITGSKGVYDLTKGVLVVTGKKVSLISGKNTITADQQLEYYEKKEMAVARRNATANHNGRVLRANTLVALFFKNKFGKSQLSRVQAFENVRIVTNSESIWADKGIYDVKSGIATLDGNIRISRDGNQLNGDSAIINLKTGVSKLLTNAGAKSLPNNKNRNQRKRKRVRGYLLPKKNSK